MSMAQKTAGRSTERSLVQTMWGRCLALLMALMRLEIESGMSMVPKCSAKKKVPMKWARSKDWK
jgi:hypothetical protein